MIFYHGTTGDIDSILENGLLSSRLLGLGPNDGNHSLPYFHKTRDRVYFTDKIEIAFMYGKIGGSNGHVLTLYLPFEVDGYDIEYWVNDRIPPECIIAVETCAVVAERTSELNQEQMDVDFYEGCWKNND